MISYPRPDFVRETRWESLDGAWDFALGEDCPAEGGSWGTIVVPFPWESEASGVAAHWARRGWYRRHLDLPVVADGVDLVLHVGAAHYEASVMVNRRPVADRLTGPTGFEINLTAHPGETIELIIGVQAPIDKRDIPHGKQRSVPADPYDGCSFTPSSGIWQSVWLEHRPRTHLAGVQLLPDRRLDRLSFRPIVAGDDAARTAVTATVIGTVDSVTTTSGSAADLLFTEPRLWSPVDPFLHEILVEVRLDGLLLDAVTCTAGLRWVETRGRHLLINGERIFLRGVLDQGYWPDTGWAAPDEKALEADLEAARAAGFNLVRKHLKIEDPRWLHAADRMGMLVWEEPPSTGRFGAAAVSGFESQLPAMIERDLNHPSVIIWGLYNEEWGLDWDVSGDPDKAAALERAYKQADALDPTRPIVDNSGWAHVRTDLVDWHVYAPDQQTWIDVLQNLDTGFAVQLGPGGLVRKRLLADGSSAATQPVLNSEYGTGSTGPERAWIMRWQTQELRRDPDGNGYVYCELYDIEHETAGVYDAHRRPKDGLGLRSSDSHADTVIVIDIVPQAPGRDLVVDGPTHVGCRVSSHVRGKRRLSLTIAWGPPLSTEDGRDQAIRVGTTVVRPYELADPIAVPIVLPEGSAAARLHLWVTGAGDEVVAHTVLDVVAAAGSL